jgi:hypothetical protein
LTGLVCCFSLCYTPSNVTPTPTPTPPAIISAGPLPSGCLAAGVPAQCPGVDCASAGLICCGGACYSPSTPSQPLPPFPDCAHAVGAALQGANQAYTRRSGGRGVFYDAYVGVTDPRWEILITNDATVASNTDVWQFWFDQTRGGTARYAAGTGGVGALDSVYVAINAPSSGPRLQRCEP